MKKNLLQEIKRMAVLAGIRQIQETKNFAIKVKHDAGVKTIKTSASDESAAKKKVCDAEGCPESAIVSCKEVVNEANIAPPSQPQVHNQAQQQVQHSQQQQSPQTNQEQPGIQVGKEYQLQLTGILSDPIVVSGKFHDWTAAQGGGTFIVEKSNQLASDWGQKTAIHLPLSFLQKPVNPLNVQLSHGAHKQYNNVTVKIK